MTAPELLSQLRRKGASVRLVGGQLSIRAPAEILTAEFRNEVTRLKPDIIHYLSAANGGAMASASKWKPHPRPERLPLSFAQERIWLAEQLLPPSPVFNIALAGRLRGPVHVELLERSLIATTQRHEVLRTCFLASDGEPEQVIAESAPNLLRVADLSLLPAGAREAALACELQAAVEEPFDLVAGPLIRCRVWKLRDFEHAMLLCGHHTVIDGWSLGLLQRDLSEFYTAMHEKRSPNLPPLQLQYADFALSQREQIKSDEFLSSLRFWKSYLEGAPERLHLPARPPGEAARTLRGGTVNRQLPVEMAGRLREIGARDGATLFMTLLAAMVVLLRECSGQEDIVVGTAVANRDHVDLEPLVGMFANVLPLRTRTAGAATFSDVVHRVRQSVLDAFAHRAVPFEKIVEVANPVRSASHTPLFQVLFILQNAPRSVLQLPGTEGEWLAPKTGAAQYELALIAEENEEGLELSLEYSADLFGESAVEDVLDRFEHLLSLFAWDPQARVDNLPKPDLAGGSGQSALDRTRGNPSPSAGHTRSYVGPRTPSERLIARCWGDALGVSKVGASDNFFDLGGHSILAMKLIARIRQVTGTPISLRSIFEAPTVEGLAKIVDELSSVRRAAATPAELSGNGRETGIV